MAEGKGAASLHRLNMPSAPLFLMERNAGTCIPGAAFPVLGLWRDGRGVFTYCVLGARFVLAQRVELFPGIGR